MKHIKILAITHDHEQYTLAEGTKRELLALGCKQIKGIIQPTTDQLSVVPAGLLYDIINETLDVTLQKVEYNMPKFILDWLQSAAKLNKCTIGQVLTSLIIDQMAREDVSANEAKQLPKD